MCPPHLELTPQSDSDPGQRLDGLLAFFFSSLSFRVSFASHCGSQNQQDYWPYTQSIMPAIRHSSKRKPPPEGFSDIEDDLLIFANKMKDAQNKPPPPGPKHQAQWEIFQISHQRSRYVYDLYYEKEAISKQLYDWLLKNGYADAMLIAKWKKQGYEKVSLDSFRENCMDIFC